MAPGHAAVGSTSPLRLTARSGHVAGSPLVVRQFVATRLAAWVAGRRSGAGSAVTPAVPDCSRRRHGRTLGAREWRVHSSAATRRHLPARVASLGR